MQNSHSLFKVTTSRPVAITMIFIGVIVFGWLSYSQLSLSLMPDISYPSLTIRTEYTGTAPEEIETTISRPIEEALGVVTNLFAISSVSKAGQSDVIMEFEWNTDMNEAMSEVREKLDLVFLPDDAEKPIILRYDPSLDPIIRFGLYGGDDLFYTRYIAEEQIKRELETVKGVAAVKVKGGYEEEIWVELNERKITLLGLDIQQIRQRLAQENVNLAGGDLKEGQTEYIVRTMNEFKSIDEIQKILIRLDNNKEIRLSDIANVYKTHKELQIITRVNGLESVELEVYKEADANIVEVAKNVREKVFGTVAQQKYTAEQKSKKAAEQKGKPSFQERRRKKIMTNFIAYNLPQQLEMKQLTDQSVFITNSINEVKNTAYWGGLLAIIILFLFLNRFNTTLIVGLSIPISIVATFAPMKLFEVSLNIMSLGGLALGIGMLVDNSIVVTESIFRCREEGDSLLDSVVRGTSEVGSAVTASTLTTIAVFFPMVFVKGVAGQIFGDLALTVVFSLLASLGVALFFIPMLSSLNFDLKKMKQDGGNTAKHFFTKFGSIQQIISDYKDVIGFIKSKKGIKIILLVLVIPWTIYILIRFIIFIALNIISKLLTLIFILAGFLFKLAGLLLKGLYWLHQRSTMVLFNWFMNKSNQIYPIVLKWSLLNKSKVLMGAGVPLVLVIFVVLPNLGRELIPEVHQGEFYLDLRLAVGTPVEKTVETIQPIEQLLLNEDKISKIATVAGIDLTKISDGDAGEHTARITITLKPSNDVKKTEEEVIQSIRQKLENYSGLENKISRPVLFSFKTPLEVEIRGYNLNKLADISRESAKKISNIPGVFDVKSNLQSGNPEIQIIYNRPKLAYFGLNILDVANIIRNKVRGDVATQFKKEDRRIDVRVKIRDADKATVDRLKRINVDPNGAVPIQLQSIADIVIKEGPSEIRRINQQRSAIIMANISGRDLFNVSNDVYSVMQEIDFPADFNYEITGQNKEMEVSLNSLRMALMLAIFMVYIVMASQFESFVHPFVILFTVPLALIGVVLVLYVMGIPLNIMVFLGLIMLAGIVVNNAIVLVDYMNQLRNRGLSKMEAIMKAGQARLRPILMTSMTTVLGLLPMALGLGDGAEIRTPMAITVIAGLISATALTLIIIPTVYAIVQRGE